MKQYQQYLRPAFVSALGYGVGSLLGAAAAALLDNAVDPWRFLIGSQALRLVQGVLLAFVIVGISGLISGFVGGWFLPHVGESVRRSGYALQSSLLFGIGFGLLVFPILLIISLLSYYDVPGIPVTTFGLVFGMVGLLFGLLVGAILGTWTLRRFNAKVTWAAVLGFGLGGIILGLALRQMLLSATQGKIGAGGLSWLLLGYVLFSALGGFGLGIAYARVADQMQDGPPLIHRLTARKWVWRLVLAGAAVLILVLLIRPVMAAVGDLLTPVDASLSPVLDLKTNGTHWLEAVTLSEAPDAQAPALAAGRAGDLALVWVEDEGLKLARGQWSAAEQQVAWQEATPVAAEISGGENDPAVVIDSTGRVHVAWVGAAANGVGTAVFVTACEQGGCSDPLPIAVAPGSTCPADIAQDNKRPSLAIDDRDQILLVWENAAGVLPYAYWLAGEAAPESANGCVPLPDTAGSGFPRVAADGADRFVLVTSSGGQVYRTEFSSGQWGADPQILGSGLTPELTVAGESQEHLAWCNGDEIIYWHAGTAEAIAALSCASRPQVAVDEKGQVHTVWHADRVENSAGTTVDHSVVYESVRNDAGQWSAPAIAGRTAAGAQPALVSASDGTLHLAWRATDQLSAAAQVQYACDEQELSDLARIMYDEAREEEFMPPSDPVPFCQNRFDRLIFTPNPMPEFSDQEPTVNGAFDKVADLVRGAQYEVLYSTMWYDAAANHDSPGAVVAQGVGDLYRQVKANPENYPRGMTVRVLLDNPPEMARGEFTGQLWSLLEDMRYAGVEKMVDEEIGWRLEVANYEGSMPHSHVKTVIIDGKTAVAAGFNMSYIHFEKDHSSGKGNDRVDMGLQITGPVAQTAVRMFDDMWDGADKRHCVNFYPPLSIPWQTLCFDSSASADHVPEVLKFYLPGADSTAFSLYRSKVRDTADKQIVEAMRTATKSLDIIQVNFTLDMVCDLNIVFDICTSDISPEYVEAMFEAARNGAKVRIIVKPAPFEGIENTVALTAFEQTIAAEGLQDQFELRFYEQDMHHKVVLIDEQVLVVGSQNFHYSAFGEGGLNEFSFAIEDPQAVEDFQRAFERMWEVSVTPNHE